MDLCWWCRGRLIWDNDFDAEDYYCDENAEGICTFLHCSQCEAIVTYEPSPEWRYREENPS